MEFHLKACIFDLDGVIVDTAGYHFLAWRRLANSLGFDFTEVQNEELKGVSRRESLELILHWGGVQLSEEDKLHWMELKNNWYLEFIEKMTPEEVLPGAKELLTTLREKGIKIALGSASKNSQLILKRTLMLDYFDSIVDGNRTSKAKPNPEVFLLGAQDLGVNPSEAVVFEDALKGVEGARNGGFKVVGIGEPEVLKQADFVVKSLAEVGLEDLEKLW